MGDDAIPRQRRELLEKILVGGFSATAAVSLAGCTEDTPGTDTVTGSATDTTRIRRSIASLQQSDPDNIIKTYREAIKKMQNLPADDPRNWQNQVAIHGVYAPNSPGWRSSFFTECEHWNWLFLPWHRLYLAYFEEICRELTGNMDFALPFWNWARNPQLPDVFGQNHGSVTGPNGNNPLYNGTRGVSPGDSITSSASFSSSWGPSVLDSQVLSDPNFQRAVGGGAGSPKGNGSSTLESYHDTIHGWVGGDMGRANSPNDPIFFTHHCMVDCVWWEWNARRGHSNPNDSDWLDGIEVGGSDPAFESTPDLPPPEWPTNWGTPRKNTIDRGQDFVDSKQNAVTGNDATTLATLFMPLFTYHYEDVAKGSEERPTDTPIDTATDDLERHLEEGANVRLETERQFPVAEGLTVPLEEPINIRTDIPVEELRPIFLGEQQGELLLRANGIVPPERPDQETLVFVNRPDVFQEPTADDPGFAGSMTFSTVFGHHDHLSKSLKLNRPFRMLDERGLLEDDQPVSVQIISLPIDPGNVEPYEGEHAFGIETLDLANTVHVEDREEDV